MGSLSLLQGIFPTQGSNPGLLHCRQVLYQLSHMCVMNSDLTVTLWGGYSYYSCFQKKKTETER